MIEQAGHGFIEHIDVANDRGLDLRPLHKQLDLVKLPHVVAELRDHPLGTAMEFAGQLEILRH